MKDRYCLLSFVLMLTVLFVIFVGCGTDGTDRESRLAGESDPAVEQIITPPTPASTDAEADDPPVVPVVPEKPVNGEVVMYTDETWWIGQFDAFDESLEMAVQLHAAGIPFFWLDANGVRDWMLETKGNGAIDVLVLYGDIPDTIYPPGNARPNGSLAETWLETTDGDTILNHADWIFWGGGAAKNREAGLQNIMDIPGITMWGDNTPMRVTVSGRAITPTLKNFQSDRPFPLDQLGGNWFAELVLASNTGDGDATRADPVVVRDGDLGRIAIVYQTFEQDDPKGEVAAEIIINHLMK